MADIVLKRMVTDLAKIDGLMESIVTSKDGVVLAEHVDRDPDGFGALCTFAGSIGEQVCTDMDLGELSDVVVSGAGSKILTVPHDDYFVGAGIDGTASVTIVEKEIRTVLRGL